MQEQEGGAAASPQLVSGLDHIELLYEEHVRELLIQLPGLLDERA